MSEFFQNLWDGKKYVSTDGEFELEMMDMIGGGRRLALKARVSVATHHYVESEITWAIVAMKEWVLKEASE